LSGAERDSIDNAMKNLQTARMGNDDRAIKKAIDEADRATADFAARRMDQSIKQALTGHTLEEFEQDLK
jgi:molecular chaperone HscA